MLAALVIVLRSLALICAGHRAVALENLALRQQLAVFKRTVPRPSLRHRDRLFWVLFAHAWRDWRSSLIVVRPDTVVRWYRQRLRRRWTQRSRPTRPGRPSTSASIRRLVEANGCRESPVGRAANPRRILQARSRRLGADRLAALTAAPPSALTDMALAIRQAQGQPASLVEERPGVAAVARNR
jgi:hypothetical protein